MEMLRDGLHHSLKENEDRLRRLGFQPKAEMQAVKEEAIERLEGNRHERRAQEAIQRKIAKIEVEVKARREEV